MELDEFHRKVKSEAALRGIPVKELVIRALEAYLKISRKEG
jgi:hypothetical protein